MVLLSVFLLNGTVFSQTDDPLQLIGTTQSTNLYPTEVITKEWAGIENVLSPDLGEGAIYQDFDARTAAYVPGDIDVLTTDLGTKASTTTTTGSSTNEVKVLVAPTSTESSDTGSATNNNDVPDLLPESVPDISQPDTTTETEEVTVYKRATESLLAFFSVVTDKMPFTNAASNTVPETTTSTILVDESTDIVLPEETVLGTTTDSDLTTPTDPQPSTNIITATTTVIAAVDVVSTTSTETSETMAAANTNEVTTAAEITATSTLAQKQLVIKKPTEAHTLTLTDFSMPALSPGESITGVQLRASLAALVENSSSSETAHFTFTFITPSSSQEVGTVLVEDEVSNALNGGYFLFALPGITEVEDFDNVSIAVTYHGNREDLNGVYLDALWLEVDTEIITKEDLLQRAEQDILKRLEKPKVHDFVSTKFDFSRFEAPVFNLTYISQRSKPVQAIRSLFGRSKVKVDKVSILHQGEGLVGIKPDVNVTSNGLVSVSISDTEKAKLKPGLYTVELEINEGGYHLKDSFQFQWGLLSINPNKTEYDSSEDSYISMGALTPNGNTLCAAALRLYVVDPNGFVNNIPVQKSGLCNGNNVIDVPDYFANYTTGRAGTYEMFLERIDEVGDVIAYTTDTFLVNNQQEISIERNGPTRIYPPAPYAMELTVKTEDKPFSGTLTEKVPGGFKVFNTNAVITNHGSYQELTWDLSMFSSSTEKVSYEFDAPDLSPYLYQLGPAELISKQKQKTKVVASSSSNTASSSASTSQTSASTSVALSPVTQTASKNSAFLEHRQWQIASDATGNMIMLWSGTNIPQNWSCLSCGSGTFYQRFAVGSSSYNYQGGNATHTPTAVGSVNASTDSDAENFSSGVVAGTAHTHTYSPNITGASNLPSYRELRYIQYTASAGEPAATSAITSLPTGVIGVFDVASSSLPTGWVRYAPQDGYYIRGGDTVGTTGGANTHNHTVDGTTGAAAGTTVGARGGGTAGSGAAAGHTHTISTTTDSLTNEPPYIEVVLGQLTATASAPNNLIAMWTEDVPSGWIDVSADSGDPFYDRYLKASTTYGATGGTTTHKHANISGVISSGPSGGAVTTRTDASGAAFTHTHGVDITSFSTDDHTPPFTSVVYGKRQGTNPVYEQTSFWWFVNDVNNQTPSDAWSANGDDLVEGEPITATTTVLKDGDLIRLRLGVGVTNATATVGSTYKLQYAAANTCSAATAWYTVGDTSSSTVWRGEDNSGVSDHSTLATALLASTTVLETYEENGYATNTPNQIPPGDFAEWDFVLENNGAATGTVYCFRMVEGDGSTFNTYTRYPKLLTNSSPEIPTLSVPFDNEKTASTSLKFRFVATDSEGEKVHYQIQIDDNYDFSSVQEQRDSISNSTQFENQLNKAQKSPYTQGELVEFTAATTFQNGSTTYWRVRAKDPLGSNSWGDWSDIWSVTIDTSLNASAWFQTQDEQFESNTLNGVEAVSGSAQLISGSTTGTMVSDAITFADGDRGTAWESLDIVETDSSDVLDYQIEYLTDAATWSLIPDSDLPGNSSGLSSTTNLLNLDINTYSIIRLTADFTANTGSPSLQDWTVNWGYRVETPTISKLFANEKTGTTTPIFEFTTTDPQGDGLTYEISWSTTTDFAASTTRNSTTTPNGFSNIDSSGDNDPFFSGDTIQYKVQPADALATGTTYWWRVRAKDSTGDDVWSFWTDIRSFTVDDTVVASTWFQTTEEQFDTNILSGTKAIASDSVTVATTAAEAIIIYGEGTATTPKYRQWDGSAWSSEGDMSDIGAALVWAKVKAGTTREEYVAVTAGADADVNAQVFSTGAWGNLQEMTTNTGGVSGRTIDVAYETNSGDAMVVYCNNAASPNYRIWDGSSWSLEGTITVSETTNCDWIQLASDPTSDELIVLVRGTDGNPYEAQVWNSTTDTWGNSTTLGNITDSSHEGMAVAYEESGNQAIVVTSDGNPARFEYNTWNGTAWGTSATQGIQDDLEWGSLVADFDSDEMALCYQDEDTNIGTAKWSGSAWSWAASDEHLTTTGKAKTDPGFACVFDADGDILTVFTDTDSTDYELWNGASWSTATTVNSIGDAITMELKRTGVGETLAAFFDETNDSLLFSHWDGSAWATTTTIENDVSVDTSMYGHPYNMAPRNDGNEGTTIVSPAINFSDGSGPYWEQMSWNDNQPVGTTLLYYLQYYDGDSWEFIPNSDLPGNESGTSTGPIDLTGLNKNTYDTIRPYAELTCDGAGTCPSIQDWTIEWAEGLTVSGTLYDYTRSTPLNSGQIGVAVNGVVQSGKNSGVSGGVWSISNVTVFPGDIITTFINGTSSAGEAVGVTRYDGFGDISGIDMFTRHVSLGSNDATSTPLTNADIGLIEYNTNEDIFVGYSTTTNVLHLCGDSGCGDVVLYVNASTTYTTTGNVFGHDLFNNGTIISTSTLDFNGSWDNNATTTLTNSTVIFSATSTVETIDSTGAAVSSFNNLTLGTTTGNATWTLSSILDVNGDLTVSYGTLSRGSTLITLAGDLLTEANGYWLGIGTTTFDGGAAATWGDQNATLQNVGDVLIDGDNKLVTLSGNVAANSITIGANDTLDVSAAGNYDISVYSHWTNNNAFLARSGEVFFVATTTGRQIDVGGDSFYDLTFNGAGGGWSFVENTLTVTNDFTVSTGTVNMTTATTSIGGSFDSTGGRFAHSNGVIEFTSAGAETITQDGDNLYNAFGSVYFSGDGSWTMTDTNSTTSINLIIAAGSVTFPSGTLTVGGSLLDTGGSFTANGGTVVMDSNTAADIQTGGSSFNHLNITGSGVFTFLDTNADIDGDLLVSAGTLTLPSGNLIVGGSWTNNGTVDANTGLVTFDSADSGETVNFGSSDMYDVTFESTSGGWTITADATTTNNFTLASSSDFTLAAAQTLSVGNVFTNYVGGASTTWTGSTLSLESGSYTVNTKTLGGDQYDTLAIAASADVKMWNSVATTTTVITGGSLYSMDHSAIDGDLYIWGDYNQTSSAEYWSFATDFDGTDLSGGSERQANVYMAAGASASLDSVLFEVVGNTTASTTVQNQGSGTYTISVSGGTTTMQYYDFSDLGATGLSLLASTTVTTLRDGSFTVAAAAGSAITLSSTTIDANPAKQIYNVTFATTTAISATNVTQIDGTPVSYWWFRDSKGNLDGESFDLDPDAGGNPGTVRWDDSALILTIRGTIYQDDEGTLLGGNTCDNDVDNAVRVVVDGGATYDGDCLNDSTYSVSGVTVVGDQVLTVYLNGAPGGEEAVAVTKTATADVTDMDLYVNRVITRHEDVMPLTIADMAEFDGVDDPDIIFTAATGTLTDTLSLIPDTELHIWATTTFTPGGTVTLNSGGTGNSYDGSLHIGDAATFTGAGTTTYYVGGSITLGYGASYVPASTTIQMTATTSGKTITTQSGETLNLDELQFVGIGGGWNLNGNLSLTDDLTMSTGTLTGTGDVTLLNGSFSGNGLVSLGGGEVTIAKSNTLGGTQGWTFNDLTLGDGTVVGTTTPASNATTTIGGVLTISNAHFLDAGSSIWNLNGSGAVFVETGNLLEDTSTFVYSGTAGMNILATDYYNLLFSADGGAPTYTATGLGIQVFGDMTVGGFSATTVTFDTNDTALNIDGDLTITSNGTLIASDNGSFTLAGNYDNNGAYTANSGTLTLDGAGTVDVAAGNSVFATVDITGSGDYTFSEHATSMTAFTIGANLSSFTLSSGQVLSAATAFSNELGGAATTWTGSTLHLFGGGSITINASTTNDTYGVLMADDTTGVRMWNSSAATVTTAGSGSVYSMDHANVDGDLYVYGQYEKTSGIDYWGYATDFDGTDLSGGSERKVDVFVEGGDSITYVGTSQLSVTGDSAASTTIQNQGSGVVGFHIGGNASTTMNYYEMTDLDSNGLTFSGTPDVQDLSYGYFLIANNGDTGITVGGTVIDANPAKTFTQNIFATSSGVSNATNTTATGTSVSSWRFTNHSGDIDGENFDVDPDGDPGYIVWDDSAASITIAGTVYDTDESTVSNVCSGATIRVRVAGLTSYDTTCNGSGVYSVSGVTYSPGDSIVAYIVGETENGATVTVDPVSNINNMDIYENRLIVRHESSNPISIVDIAAWDSSDDAGADLFFTAVDSTPDTLTLPADYKLIVWDSKEFEPGGNVTVSGGGAGASYDGTVELQSGATYTANPGETLTVGGSLTSAAGATYSASTATTSFTTSGAGRTIDINDGSFYNVNFAGSGSWSVTDTIFDINNLDMSAGTLTLPTGTTTVSGYFDNAGGTIIHNGSLMVFDATTTGNTVTFGGSDVAELNFTGSGSWTMDDTNATSTSALTVYAGTLTLPSGTLSLGDSFRNVGGAVTHNTSELIISTSTTATILASSSDLYAVTFAGGGTFGFEDYDLTLLDTLTINSGSLSLATGTLSIGGSFDAAGGTFAHNSTGTVLFNSADTGETIDPGVSDFYNVVFGSASGGWTITAPATSTNNFTLTAASSFTLQSGQTLYVGGVFDNSVGGTATDWSGSTLILDPATSYSINSKTDAGEDYEALILGANADLRMWNSKATTTTVDPSSSLYSQNHASSSGDLNIYGDFHIGTTTEYWSYATDFDGTSLTGSERVVTVSIASGATTTLDGGTLNIVGASGNETTITNQGSGTYDFNVTSGTFNAQYYAFRNLNAAGLTLSGTPTISSLSYGDFELAVNGGRLINLSSTTLNANASLVITGNRFATTTAITGTNVYLTGITDSAWTFTGHTGNLDGESFDFDGGTGCGQVRWDDSTCQLIQQTHYRWRDDNGGLGVPNGEWMNTNWDARKAVRIDNPNSTTTPNAVVELTVDYDNDMQTDFGDLRFTDSTGVTVIDHFIASTTDSVSAEVWVEVPSLTANDTTVVYMYYNNPTASSTSSSTLTFIAADDFEDNNIAEYSGTDKSFFAVDATYAYGSSYGLDNSGNEAEKATNGGMARFDQTISQGETIRYMQYVDTNGGDDEVCTLFGVQSPVTASNNYAICTEQVTGTDFISIAKDVVFSSGPTNILASSSVVWSDGWYEIEVDWADDDSISVYLYDDSENLVASTSVTDASTPYSTGGYGFTFWFNEGGWDNITSRPTLVTEPTVRFGAEVTDGGADWLTTQDTAYSINGGDTVRLRFAIENTGLATTTTLGLEYADKGAAPSCEAVTGASYTDVPNQASCGSSPICMQTTTNYADGASTADLLIGADGTYTVGEAVESPSNETGNVTIDQDEYTEVEYTLVSTINAIADSYCLRVGAGGGQLDTYLKVAEMQLRYDPSMGIVYMDDLDGLNNINLIGGTTTRVYATTSVSDQNGYADMVYATSTFYHSDATAACIEDPNNCYVETQAGGGCSFTGCSGNSCTLECYADFYYFASSTDDYGGKFWYAFMEVEDSAGGIDFGTSDPQDVTTLNAISVSESINYGSLAVYSTTTAFINPTTTIENIGNNYIDINLDGADLTDGLSSIIPTSQQKFATTSFNYDACTSCTNLSTTTIVGYELDLIKPTSTTTPITDDVYWGISIPFGVASNPHSGLNTFYAVND